MNPSALTRDSSGMILCPRCGTALARANSSFSLHGEFLGKFESLVCPMCNFSALTGKGYEQAIMEAQKFGLVGMPEPRVEVEIYNQKLEVATYNTSANNMASALIFRKDGQPKQESSGLVANNTRLLPKSPVIVAEIASIKTSQITMAASATE